MSNVFVLTAGRSGSKTLAAALSHLPGWTVGHEMRVGYTKNRFDYPDNHIEVDNRLSWMLGTLAAFPDARYVWLRRDPEAIARSYARRMNVRGGIMSAFDSGILLRPQSRHPDNIVDAARLMVDVIENNIATFLLGRRDRHLTTIWIEKPEPQFDFLWRRLAPATGGPTDAALAEFDVIRDRTA